MAPAVPAPAPGPCLRMFDVVLLAPTANGVKQIGPEVTYINRGSYKVYPFKIVFAGCVQVNGTRSV